MGKRIEFSESDLAYLVNAIDISNISYEELGKEFGCSRTTIWRRYKEAKADLPDTELARLSDERKKRYRQRESAFIKHSLRKKPEVVINPTKEDKQKFEEEYKSKYPQVDKEEVEEGFFEKVKSWFKYILTGGDSGLW
jgi:DNA-binding Lrp family transcriptional regulator